MAPCRVVSIPGLIKAAIAYSIPPRNGLVNSLNPKRICGMRLAYPNSKVTGPQYKQQKPVNADDVKL